MRLFRRKENKQKRLIILILVILKLVARSGVMLLKEVGQGIKLTALSKLISTHKWFRIQVFQKVSHAESSWSFKARKKAHVRKKDHF